MAQNIYIKRSAVSGKVPVTADLGLGEFAVNTYDGRIFIKKNVSGTESIVTFAAYDPANVMITGGSATVNSLSVTGNTILGDASTDTITLNGKLAAGGITFADGTNQNSAGTTQGFSIAMAIALG